MFFADDSGDRLSRILQGAAIGEALGVLASRMSPAERAEKLTPEGFQALKIDPSVKSTTVELLNATISGLEHASSMDCPSNLEIRICVHEAYRDWATSSPSASKSRNQSLNRALTSGPPGSFTTMERGSADGMLRVSPIGLAFASDPGRAFQIGAEAAALADAEFNSYLCAGVVSLVVALVASDLVIREAIDETIDFIRPLDWPGEISEALRRSLEPESGSPFFRASVSETLRIGISAVASSSSKSEALSKACQGADTEVLTLVGQLTGAVGSRKLIIPSAPFPAT